MAPNLGPEIRCPESDFDGFLQSLKAVVGIDAEINL
jgi:hypothetical protein